MEGTRVWGSCPLHPLEYAGRARQQKRGKGWWVRTLYQPWGGKVLSLPPLIYSRTNGKCWLWREKDLASDPALKLNDCESSGRWQPL